MGAPFSSKRQVNVTLLKGLLGTVIRQMKLAPDLDARFPRVIQRSVVRINLEPMVFCFVLDTVFSLSYLTPWSVVLIKIKPASRIRLQIAVACPGLDKVCDWGTGCAERRELSRGGAATTSEAACGRLDAAQTHLVRAVLGD
jgi:hypothetical protein